MIDDGTKENGRDDIVVQDISMHLLEAIEKGEQRGSAVGAGVSEPAD
jgi:hypothetical protein